MDGPTSTSADSKQTHSAAQGEVNVAEAREIPVLPFHVDLLDHVTPSSHRLDNIVQLLYVDATSVEKLAHAPHTYNLQQIEHNSCPTLDSDVTNIDTINRGLTSLLALSDSHHSDLIPGVYEGGLKVWECAFDLVEYLAKSEISFSGKRVLELGCGIGLPAIYALTKGAEEVHFQDYNPQVIDYVTIPSVLLNVKPNSDNLISSVTSYCNNCKFYSGDWSSLTAVLPSRSYDIILTSETIYSLSSQPKLLTALKCLLRPQVGVAYVAAKSFYFGVGGSVSSFVELLREDGYFHVEKCHVVDYEISREILMLKPKQ